MVTPNADIVPVQLSLTSGDLITLWAPRWRENGEDWEAFLGDEDSLFAFPDAAALAAFVRTVAEHDLADHPAWPLVRTLRAAELVPQDAHCYDLVGVPELAADNPDTWTVGELAEIVTVTRALADTCGLDAVHTVLDSAPGFALLDQGSWAFDGREGRKLWVELADTVVRRWDEVIDALDALVREPEVDADALSRARAELATAGGADARGGSTARGSTSDDPTGHRAAADGPTGDGAGANPRERTGAPATAAGPESFWQEVGIDPILIGTAQGEYYTLRCYLDDKPLFLGSQGRIQALPSARALARHLAGEGATDHDLTTVSTWSEVVAAAESGELAVEVEPENTYLLTGLGDDLADGPAAIDPNQLDLAVELVRDVGEWAGDDDPRRALAQSQSLGWLTSFVLRPDPTRLAPSPPFDAEAGRWNALVDGLVARLYRP